MKKPRGKCPSLISGSLGRPKFEVAMRKRTCKRCHSAITAGTKCVSIPVPGSMGDKTYCCNCLLRIIERSQKDLGGIRSKMST